MHRIIAALGAPRARLTLAYLALVAGERLPRLLRSATRATPGPSDQGVDLGALLAVAVGAHALAGYALRPVREARARQERFAAAASHELRTPVTVLLGTLEATLLRPRAPEEYERIVRRAVEEAALLAALLDDLLPFAHDDDPAPPVAEPLDLRAVARGAAEDARPASGGKGQELVLALDGPLPVRGDAPALARAVAALLDNAVTYTAPGGAISLVGRRSRDRATLAVRDTGPGIAPRHLPHLREPFYRVDPTHRDGAGHPGLGLARADRVVRAHDGHLAIQSRVGVGSTFTLSLPLDRTPVVLNGLGA